MTPARWEQIKALFDAALAVPEGEPRQALLAAADPGIVGEVIRLLELNHQADEFLSKPLPGVEHLRVAGSVLCPGQTLNGRFEIRRALGHGGMGQVFEAFDRDLQQVIAVKVVSPDADGTRFLSEIQTARRVTHPNVCRIFDIERDGEIVFCTMELLTGETLAGRLKHGPLPLPQIVTLAIQLCSGLAAAHDAGILHRDLKPGNVMVEEPFRAVITDFGLAHPIPPSTDAQPHTGDNEIVGTLPYMAPEVLARREASAQADIYSLGVLLYEAATGQLPFESAGSLASLVRRALETPKPPSVLNKAIPQWLDDVILSCLRPTPSERPRSARMVAGRITNGSVVARRVALRWAIGGVGVAGGMSLLALVYRYKKQESRPTGIRTVLLAIQNPQDSRHLSGMSILLRQQLEQSARIETLTESRLAEILSAMASTANRQPEISAPRELNVATAREVALRNGSTLVLYGSITQVGPEYRLELILEEPSRPDLARYSWKKDFSANGEQDLLSRARDAAMWVREMAGETPLEIDAKNRSPEQITTWSWDALSLMNEARNKRTEGKFEDAETLLKEALAIDPGFPSAARELADLLVSERKSKEGYQAWEAAVKTSRTRQLNSRERYRLEALYADDVEDLAQAEQANKAWIVNYPLDYLPHFLLGNVYLRENRMAEALSHMQEASRLQPRDQAVEMNLAYHYLVMGNDGDARKQVDRFKTLGSPPVVAELEGKAQFLWGHLQESAACFERMRGAGRMLAHRGALLSAACLAERGWWDEASEGLRKLLPVDEANGDWPWRARKLIYLAELARLQSRTRESIAHAELALTLDGGDFVQEMAGVLLARCAAHQSAAKALAALRALPALPRVARRILRLEGEIALATRDLATARELLTRSAQQTTTWDLNDSLARAFESSGALQEAFEERIRLARAKGFLWTVAERLLPGAWTSNLTALVTVARSTGRHAEAEFWSQELHTVRS